MLDAPEAGYAQDNRLLKITTTLGENKVLLTRLSGYDAVSHPFGFSIEIATREKAAKVRSLLGKPLTMWIGGVAAPEPRPVHGIVRSLTRVDQDALDFNWWRAEVVPQFALLDYTGDCRIFQSLTVPAIIKKVLGEHNLDFETRSLLGNYPTLDYCVQYRESTFAFLSRLMEHNGMYYWHEHSAEGHKLVITDSNTALRPAFVSPVSFVTRQASGQVLSLEESYVFRPGKWSMTDYDFEVPTKPLKAAKPTTLDVTGMAKYEVYDYPGGYTDAGAGGDLALFRIQQEEAQHHRMSGTASTCGFDAGRKVVVTRRYNNEDDQTLMLAVVRHEASDLSHVSDTGEPARYHASFEALPYDVQYRPELRTRKPAVRGPQTATVTGPSGAEIHTDKHGRVKVRFHWDRNPDGNKDENSSCWLRVSQAWAGKEWGSIHIPRIGQEVIVDFLEGNPDCPIITGRVYNGTSKPPYGLPGNATQSGIKSNSSKGGGGSNELRFEDKKGSEQVYFHAEKDLETLVENDEKHTVGHDRTVHVKHNEKKTVDVNKETEVKGNFKEKVLGTETRDVTGNVKETYLANEEQTITGNKTLTLTGNLGETITGNVTQTVTGNYTQTVVGEIMITTPKNVTITSAGNITVVAPAKKQATPDIFKVSATNMGMYGFTTGIIAIKTEIAATSTALTPQKFETTVSKMEIGFFHAKTTSTEMKTVSAKLETVATKIKSGAVAIQNAAMKLIN